MIEVLQINDTVEIKDFYKQNNVEFVSNCGVTVAKNGEEILGFCTFILDDEKITITKLSPTNDVFLADGILRSALHIADFRGISTAFFTDNVDKDLLILLKFIENEEKKTLNIEKLHESCCSCNN